MIQIHIKIILLKGYVDQKISLVDSDSNSNCTNGLMNSVYKYLSVHKKMDVKLDC